MLLRGVDAINKLTGYKLNMKEKKNIIPVDQKHAIRKCNVKSDPIHKSSNDKKDKTLWD